jgi:hypothetical protein
LLKNCQVYNKERTIDQADTVVAVGFQVEEAEEGIGLAEEVVAVVEEVMEEAEEVERDGKRCYE